MFLLSPQYWLLEGLILFLLTFLLFRVLAGTKSGRAFLSAVFGWNDPESVANDAAEVRRRAKRVLPRAAADVEHDRTVVRELRQATGEPVDDELEQIVSGGRRGRPDETVR